jgi:hypothetical protein
MMMMIEKVKYKEISARPRIFYTRGGSEFQAYPFPSNRLGSCLPYTASLTAPSRNAGDD